MKIQFKADKFHKYHKIFDKLLYKKIKKIILNLNIKVKSFLKNLMKIILNHY